MNEGLMWYNEHKKSLPIAIREAATCYQEKHKRVPDTCYVHPAEQGKVEGVRLGMGDVRVLNAPNVLRGHLWIGNKDD